MASITLSQLSFQKRIDVQSLRAVAVLAVIFFHAGSPIPGGFLGVDIFFVISGFVITGMLLREFQKQGKISLRNFYWRRSKRLLPALSVLLVAVTFLSAFVLSPFGPQQVVAGTAIGSLFLSGNIAIAQYTGGYFDSPAAFNPLLNLWSLSVEEQFYLIFPLLIIAGIFTGLRLKLRWVTFSFIAGFTFISFVLAIIVIPVEGQVSEFLFGFYGVFARSWEFGVGALLVFIPREIFKNVWVSISLFSSGAILIGYSYFRLTEVELPTPGIKTLIPVIGTALVILADISQRTFLGRIFLSKPFSYIGDVSYSLYIWHWPLIVFALLLIPNSTWAITVAITLTFVLGILSYHFVENPLRHRSFNARKAIAFFSILIGAPLISSAVLFSGAQAAWGDQAAVEGRRASEQLAQAVPHNCFQTVLPGGEWDEEACTFGQSRDSASPVYLVGDSNAFQFADGVYLGAQDAGRKLILRSASGCPLVDLELVNFRDPIACRAFGESTVEYLLGPAQRGTVVIANSDLYPRGADLGFVDGSRQLFDLDEKYLLYEQALERTVSELVLSGYEVILVETIPNWLHDPYEREAIIHEGCTASEEQTFTCKTMEESLAVKAERQSLNWEIQSRVAANNGAKLLSFRNVLCPDETCVFYENGKWRYSDANHVSGVQSIALRKYWSDALAR